MKKSSFIWHVSQPFYKLQRKFFERLLAPGNLGGMLVLHIQDAGESTLCVRVEKNSRGQVSCRYHHTGNGMLGIYLSVISSWLVGLRIQGAHFFTYVIYLLIYLEIEKV